MKPKPRPRSRLKHYARMYATFARLEDAAIATMIRTLRRLDRQTTAAKKSVLKKLTAK